MIGDRTFQHTSIVCRLPDTTDAIIRPVSELHKAAELRESQGLGRLHTSGWMEDALAFTEGRKSDGEQACVNVLVIPEDFRKDQYILKPLFNRLFRSIGRSSTRVQVCQDPLLGGVREALKPGLLAEIVERYGGMTDIFILCVDRDGEAGRRQRLDQIEAEMGNGRAFLAENAWEELETWVLAGLDLLSGWTWADVRAEIHVKERFFDVLARARGIADGPGGGRKDWGNRRHDGSRAIRQKCVEDFDSLARRIELAAS